MTRFINSDPKTNTMGLSPLEVRIKRLEQSFDILANLLEPFFVKGRLRLDRVAPANSADVNEFDQLYDIVRDVDYEYILVDDSGARAWRRITMSSF